jgi:HK97 family phage prohead protease
MALAHEKVGHTEQGLWHHKGMQLPAFIQHIANDLIADGHPTSQAIQMAIGICQRWARGGGDVKPETQAKAATAIAEWEALKAKTKAGSHGRSYTPMPYTRSFPLEDISIKAGGDGRTVDAYAAVFNVPAKVRDVDGRYEEVIDPAAFNRTLEHARRSKGSVPVLFNHGMTLYGTPSERYSVPIGVSEEIRADGNGLFTRSRFHRTQAADEILEAIRDGSITAYSFQGDFLRSEPLTPHGGFRPDRTGRLPTVRRTESTLREYGPGTFAYYPEAAIIGVRTEQIAALAHGGFTRDEALRFIDAMYQSGTPLDAADPPDDGTPDTSGPAAEDPPPATAARHSGRPLTPREELQAQRAKFLVKHGGGRIGA